MPTSKTNKFNVTKTGGEKEVYSSDKLCQSMIKSGASPETANKICSLVEKGIEPGTSTQKIWRSVLRHLVKEDLRASARYSLRRGLAHLGPDGFVFEQYIEAVLQAHGYETHRNEMVRGISGLDHEVDIFARKGKEMVFVEAKYRNEYGIRTHVDTVMYNWARFEDMRGQALKKASNKQYDYQSWLVTNTEFTSSSTKYGKFKDMHLLGWNYPKDRSLEDMIAEKQLYPVTILPSVTLSDRKALIKKGMILAQDLLPHKPADLEKRCHIGHARAVKIIEEARGLLK